MDQKIWFRTADMFLDLAHSLTDSIAKGHPLYNQRSVWMIWVKTDPIIHHTFDAGEGVLIPESFITKHGCKYFLILQPFGMPAKPHVVGRGISKN